MASPFCFLASQTAGTPPTGNRVVQEGKVMLTASKSAMARDDG